MAVKSATPVDCVNGRFLISDLANNIWNGMKSDPNIDRFEIKSADDLIAILGMDVNLQMDRVDSAQTEAMKAQPEAEVTPENSISGYEAYVFNLTKGSRGALGDSSAEAQRFGAVARYLRRAFLSDDPRDLPPPPTVTIRTFNDSKGRGNADTPEISEIIPMGCGISQPLRVNHRMKLAVEMPDRFYRDEKSIANLKAIHTILSGWNWLPTTPLNQEQKSALGLGADHANYLTDEEVSDFQRRLSWNIEDLSPNERKRFELLLITCINYVADLAAIPMNDLITWGLPKEEFGQVKMMESLLYCADANDRDPLCGMRTPFEKWGRRYGFIEDANPNLNRLQRYISTGLPETMKTKGDERHAALMRMLDIHIGKIRHPGIKRMANLIRASITKPSELYSEHKCASLAYMFSTLEGLHADWQAMMITLGLSYDQSVVVVGNSKSYVPNQRSQFYRKAMNSARQSSDGAWSIPTFNIIGEMMISGKEPTYVVSSDEPQN